MATRPNIILINCDDLGFGDIGCYGSPCNRTPAIDRLAAEGMRCTDFYMASPVCTPSRGAMLTGCYPNRIGFDLFGQHWVLFPGQNLGLNPQEQSLARLLKDQGYATALVGKWHCGDQAPFLPTAHGFDRYFGVPYSNDMGRQTGSRRTHIENLQRGNGYSYRGRGVEELDSDYPPLPLLDGDQVIQEQPDQAALTERYLTEALRFMRESAEQPFFLYFAHMYVHLPIYVPEPFRRASQNGAYGAAVEHIDWSVAVLLAELDRLGQRENTLVIFTSDNGSRARGEGGSNAPLRGHKGQTWEGGMRVPCIVRWPEQIPAGSVNRDLTASIDLLPTLVGLAGGDLPSDRTLDGVDQAPAWRTGGGVAARDSFAYFHRGTLEALRRGRWKLHFCKNDAPVSELYDLVADPAESRDLAAEQPQLVAEISALADELRAELGDRRLNIIGQGCRPIGRIDPQQADTLTHYDPQHPYFAAEYDLSDAG